MQALSIPVPPAPEQRRLADHLDTLLADIEEADRAIKRARNLMADYRASLLHAACTGALTADWRAANPHPEEDDPALLRRILTERRAAWERAELTRLTIAGKVSRGERWKNLYPEPRTPFEAEQAMMPSGWILTTLDQLLIEHPRNGVSVKGRNEPPGTPALRLDALGHGQIHYDRCRYIEMPKRKAAALTIRVGDLFVSRANGSKRLVGRASLASEPPVDTVYPDTMIRCRFVLPELGPWIATVWNGAAVRAQLEQRAKTSAGIWKLGQDDLTSALIPIPPLVEMEAVLKRTGLASISSSEIAVNGTLDLRQSILHAAFSGRLVSQDSNDEPAAVLLAGLRARDAQYTPLRRSTRGGARP